MYSAGQLRNMFRDGNHLRRKYIYGPVVDEPISLIESSGTYAGTYYYHFDGLGSVVALTSGNVSDMGDTVEVYEYDVYGRVGASVPAHPNRIMFTGREYDKETGLYYYRARYYNPQIGRFLQTDPVGYKAGMNRYAYCGNNPIGLADPSGCEPKTWGSTSQYAGLMQEGDGSWQFTISVPLDTVAVGTQDNGANAGVMDNAVHALDEAGFFEVYSGWHLVSARVSGNPGDQYVELTFRSDPTPLGSDAPVVPDIGSITVPCYDWAGKQGNPPHVSLFVIAGVRILNDYVLAQILTPEFQRIDGLGTSLISLIRNIWHWDASNLAGDDNLYAFNLRGAKWEGWQINYAVWGHMARHYNLGYQDGINFMSLYFNAIHGMGPDDPDYQNALLWYNAGYLNLSPNIP